MCSAEFAGSEDIGRSDITLMQPFGTRTLGNYALGFAFFASQSIFR